MRRYIIPFVFVVIALFTYSCSEKDIVTATGIETDVIRIESPSMTNISMSRAIDESLENKIYSLYFFIINSNGDIDSKKYIKLDNPSSSYSCKLDKRVMESQRIYAIANAEFTENSFDAANIKKQMDDVTTETQLKEIYASYDEGQENFNRPQGHLLMSGILENPSTTNNTIEVKHVDARVNFRITVADNAIQDGAVFVPTSYQIINIPRRSYLIERQASENFVNSSSPYSCTWDAVSVEKEDDYFNSEVETYFNKSYTTLTGTENKKMTAMFDFYMLENRKTALHDTGGEYPTFYSQRDQKTGIGDEWAFTNAHKYSTYVVIKGTYKKGEFELEQDLIEGTNSPSQVMISRYANVEYIIHLGDFGNMMDAAKGNTNNFYTERNRNYTYNVTINNAHSIAVEAVSSIEKQSSAEGVVADAYVAFADIDAHFGNVFVPIDLTGLSYDYFTNPSNCMESNSPYGIDYSWVQFAPIKTTSIPEQKDMLSWQTAAEGKLLVSMAMLPDFIYKVKYAEAGSAFAQYRYHDETSGRDKMYLTAFIDEYYPQAGLRDLNYTSWFMSGFGVDDEPTIPAMAQRKVSSADPMGIGWDRYINRENRELKLFNLPYTSNDGRSHYTISQVMITQRSIQTFYKVDSQRTALGVEHTDETGQLMHNNQYSLNALANEKKDGRKNTLSLMQMGAGANSIGRWADFIDYTKNSTESQVTVGDQTCKVPLQRNRDINADGIIQDSEIRWYTPAIDQLVSVSLAGQALPSPLYDQMLASTRTDRDAIPMHHISSSNRWVLWTEEIVSAGQNDNNNKLYNRCVRTLGTTNNMPEDYYLFDSSTNIVTYPLMNQSILRSTVSNGELIPMTEWDVTDRLPKNGFKIASANASSQATMIGLDESNSPCSTYSESGTAYDGVGKWRVPNLVELALMGFTGKINGISVMSCTKFSWAYKSKTDPSKINLTPILADKNGYWYGANNHHFLWWQGSNVTLSNTVYGSTKMNVRCVRDIQIGEIE